MNKFENAMTKRSRSQGEKITVGDTTYFGSNPIYEKKNNGWIKVKNGIPFVMENKDVHIS